VSSRGTRTARQNTRFLSPLSFIMKDASLTAVPEYGARELVNIVKEQAERIKLLESEREKRNDVLIY